MQRKRSRGRGHSGAKIRKEAWSLSLLVPAHLQPHGFLYCPGSCVRVPSLAAASTRRKQHLCKLVLVLPKRVFRMEYQVRICLPCC